MIFSNILICKGCPRKLRSKKIFCNPFKMYTSQTTNLYDLPSGNSKFIKWSINFSITTNGPWKQRIKLSEKVPKKWYSNWHWRSQGRSQAIRQYCYMEYNQKLVYQKYMDHHLNKLAGIIFAMLRRGPRAFQIGKSRAINPKLGNLL